MGPWAETNRSRRSARAGAQVLFLPACSPNLNPMEKMWSKAKAIERVAEARTAVERVQLLAGLWPRPRTYLSGFASGGYSFC